MNQRSTKTWRKREALPFEAAICGSISGAVAAACTTPLDVIKTRMMLGAVRGYLPVVFC